MSQQEYSKYIDHSPLKMDANANEIRKYCTEAIQYKFHSVVVYPYYIEFARELLGDSDVKLISVVGFPFGNDLIEIKEKQAGKYLSRGVDEIDMVMNLSAFKSGAFNLVKEDIGAVNEQIKAYNALLKVIIEIELLSDEEIIEASKLVADAGADFVKTSVGLLKTSKPAELEKVRLMYETVKSTGTQVKASGKIHTAEMFLKMIDAGATRIGTSKGIDIMDQLSSQMTATGH